ncbi:uncharacterized protein LY89DRAFT_669816 [Mollisia scopiformis]|uniref:Zn(2)-C6 fungal-type domain-containing protein n=1 Tax=Mollisia scopiformis TaxID=149040 RepID=A0A194X7Y8_MOLSC|nr:uncharacterized protein LY89DRAFT_669816 [Mollisia scopiformis]KUJ16286.1 hypothetical protein LY89DRAFT_669816 [Mollisia scopiformis]
MSYMSPKKGQEQCGGEEPACRRCLNHGLQCPGYSRKLEFVFYDTDPAGKRNALVKPSSEARKSSSANQMLQSKKKPSMNQHAVIVTNNSDILHESSGYSLAASQNKTGLMAVLRERYVPQLPKFSTEQGVMNGANWIATACSLAAVSEYSEMLSDSLLAMSLSLVSLEQHEAQLSTASLKQYSLAINGLRSSLAPGPSGLSQHQIDVSLVKCLACGMYEMMTNKSLSALMRHLNGVNAILKASGVQGLQSESSRRTFYEYRSIYLPIALSVRKPNFLSSSEWINPTWKRLEPLSSSNLHTVIDIGFGIPVLMEKFDELQQQDQQADSATYVESQLNNIILEGLAMQQAFDDWEYRVRDGNEEIQLYIPRLAKSPDPLDIYGNGEVYSISFTFANWDNASGLSYHEMLQITLNTLLTDIEAYARRSNLHPPALSGIDASNLNKKSIECADRVCQSVEWFLEDHKRLIGRMVILAPFETARGLFARLCRDSIGDVLQDAVLIKKRKFCEMTTQRIRDSGLPVWAE